MLFITSKGFFTLFLLCFSCRQNRRQLFPTRTEKECLTELRKHPQSYFAYQNMTQERKNRFLEFMEGTKTLPLTYDPFFKKLFNPDIYPERLSSLISSIIGTRVTVRCILSNEDSMLAVHLTPASGYPCPVRRWLDRKCRDPEDSIYLPGRAYVLLLLRSHAPPVYKSEKLERQFFHLQRSENGLHDRDI